MKGIRGLTITKAAMTLLVAGTMSLSLCSCNGYVDMGSITAEELLANSEVADVTMMDEMINAGKLRFSEELSIVEAADQLERYMDIVDALSKESFDGAEELQPLTEEQYEFAKTLSLEDIELLKEDAHYNGKEYVKLERKLTAIKMLNYLNTYCSEWVHVNGQDISVKFMMAAEKCAIGSELGLSTDDYSSIVIQQLYSVSEPESNFVEVGDNRYEIKIRSNELWNTQNYIYAVQDYDSANGNEFETYRKAINYGKITMAAGANVKNNRLEEQYNASYIEKNYVK